MIKKCLICKKEFYVKPSRKNAKFCSFICYGKSKENTVIIEKKCPNCKKIFKTRYRIFCSQKCYWENLKGKCPEIHIYRTEKTFKKISNAHKGKRYSPKTEFKKGHQPKIKFKKGHQPWNKGKLFCQIRGKNNPKWNGGKPKCKYCGKQLKKYGSTMCLKCFYKKNSGENNNQWKGGISDFNDKFRKTKKYKDWRKIIYKKYHWTCQLCGAKKDIIAHHLKLFSEFPELRLDTNNGIVLCRSCHLKVHKNNIDLTILINV